MKRILTYALTVLATVVSHAMPASAGVSYGEPDGGWAYVYEGDAVSNDQFEALDGGWSLGSGSDSWDGSEIGDGAPGGVSGLTEGDTSFIRIQDPGDPRDYPDTGVDGDPSNRKIYFDRDINDLDGINDEFLEDGFTFAFRARVATAATGPVDPWYPDGGGADDDWPAEGLAEHTIEFDSTSFISFFQLDNIGSLGFTLTTEEGPDGVGKPGFLMNDLTDEVATENGGDTNAGEENFIDIENVTDWNEFWVTIESSDDGPGSHTVNVFMNGSTEGMSFDVTAGTRKDNGGVGPLSVGLPGTSKAGAIDLDYIAIANGVLAPVAGGGGLTGDFDSSGELDVADVDLLIGQMLGAGESRFDLNNDGNVDKSDLNAWVVDLKNSFIGDANLDGEFNSGDFVTAFTGGKYEVVGASATWGQGDWNGDGIFNSGDFVDAFSGGGYEQGPRAASAAVPEPSGILLLLSGLLMLARRK